MQLTFVCSGNTCRSPLAVAAWQVVARAMSDECRQQLKRIEVSSAGLNARRGAPASAMAQLIAASWDADLSEHRARAWRPGTRGHAARVIVTMTAEQAAQIRFRLETQRESGEISVEVLGAFLADDERQTAPSWSDANEEWALDIPDPYGGSSEAYEECAARIRRAVRALVQSYCRD